MSTAATKKSQATARRVAGAAQEIALHLAYLRDFKDLDQMTDEELAESIANRLAEGGLL